MHQSIRGRRRWLVALTVLSLMALPAAAAQADDTWSGASIAAGTAKFLWNDSTNWTLGVPSTTAAGILTFPDLGTCPAGEACYTSNNNLGPVTASELVFGNISGAYSFPTSSSQIAINGNGATPNIGLTDNVGGPPGSTGGPGNVIGAPLVLNAAQTWNIGAGPNSQYNSLSLTGGVTGSTSAGLNVAFPPNSGGSATGDLFVNSTMDVGPINVTGRGGFHVGRPPGHASVNATSLQLITIGSQSSLVPNPGAMIGPVSIASGGTLLLGTNLATNDTNATTATVSGTATIGLGTTSTTFINDNGSVPGTSFSQLAANNVALSSSGDTLNLEQGPNNAGVCVTLNRGDVATLFTGNMSGVFTDQTGAVIGDGALYNMRSSVMGSCSSPPQVRINYTSNSVTATVVSGTTPTTTTLATPTPSAATTNQPVTLTATVSTTSGTVADGTVAFLAGGTPISGCGTQSVTGSGTTGTATCMTSFPASTSPVPLTAAFSDTPASGQGSSMTTSPQTLTVTQASSTTTLTASNTSPAAGGSVTYTATVTPGVNGPTEPSGAVQFRDGGTAITGCNGRLLTAGAASSTTTCTVTYPSAGSHSIIAGYGGDTSFTSSSSSPTSVRVQSPPAPPPVTTTTTTTTPPPPPPPPAIAARTSRATHVETSQALLNGSIDTGGRSVSWKFEYGRNMAYGQITPVRTIAVGQGTVPVSSVLKRLSPDTRYHYRLVVTAAGQPVDGRDVTFTTRATGSMLFSGRRLSVLGRTILITDKCQSKVLCTGRFSLTTKVRVGKKKRPATVLCASGGFRIKAHRTTTAHVRLSGACLRLLRPHRRLTVTYSSQTHTGQKGLSRRVTLVRKSPS